MTKLAIIFEDVKTVLKKICLRIFFSVGENLSVQFILYEVQMKLDTVWGTLAATIIA